MLVAISSPGPKGGAFHERWEQSLRMESKVMSFRMPTWIFNPEMPESNAFLVERKEQSKEVYDIEYGAEWPEGGASSLYFPEVLLKKALALGASLGISEEAEPRYGAQYYAHIDPAINGDNYALVVIRKTMVRDKLGVFCPRAILAKVRVWRPVKGIGLDVTSIEKEVIEICQKWRVSVLSFDSFPSMSGLSTLKRHGLNTVQTAFNRYYKNQIFTMLKDLMSREDCGLALYPDPQLLAELKNLRQKPLTRGVWIGADKRSDVKTDDAADCLAGSVFMSMGNYFMKYPTPVIVRAGFR
jgi:hypothetical protein